MATRAAPPVVRRGTGRTREGMGRARWVTGRTPGPDPEEPGIPGAAGQRTSASAANTAAMLRTTLDMM